MKTKTTKKNLSSDTHRRSPVNRTSLDKKQKAFEEELESLFNNMIGHIVSSNTKEILGNFKELQALTRPIKAIELILDNFEIQANKLFEADDFMTNAKEAYGAAGEILRSSDRLKEYIDENDIERAVLEGILLSALACRLKYWKFMNHGIGAQRGRSRSHTKGILKGVQMAIEQVLASNADMSATEVWRVLNRKAEINGGTLSIESYYIQFREEGLLHRRGMGAWSKPLKKRSFDRYVTIVRKALP